MSIDEAAAVAQVSECERVIKTLFIELVNLHADQRRDWGSELTFGTDIHYLILRKLGIYEFTEVEMKEVYAIAKANLLGLTEDEIIYRCRFTAYNQYLEYLVKNDARLDENGKLIFRAVTSEYVSPTRK